MASPARGYTWPPFEAGNEAAVKHGVWAADRSERVATEVAEIAASVATQFPWTAPYVDERLAYARAMVDERDIRAYLDDIGMLDDNHQERPAVRTLDRFSRIAARHRDALGLTPMAHARMLALVSEVVRRHPERAAEALDTGLQALLAQGRAALEATAGPPRTGREEGA